MTTNTRPTVTVSLTWTYWKQAAATELIKATDGIVKINYSSRILLHHVYTNNLSFVFFHRKSLHLCTCERCQRNQTFETCYIVIKAWINKCMYKIKSGEKHRHFKMCFLTLAGWYFPAPEKKPLGSQTDPLLQPSSGLGGTHVSSVHTLSATVSDHTSRRGAKINCCAAEMRGAYARTSSRGPRTQ